MNETFDGTIVPSFLGIREDSYSLEVDNRYRHGIYLGRVVKIHFSDDKTNNSKRRPEYDVSVFFGKGVDIRSKTIVPRCVVGNQFGSGADFSEHTLRENKTSTQGVHQQELDVGSLVVIGFLGAESTQGIILCGYPENRPDHRQESLRDAGHHAYTEFNGVSTSIDKDGQVTIQRRGATDSQGKVIDDSAGVSAINLDKAGSVALTTASESLVINHEDKQITMTADEGVLVGQATDAMPLFETYRQQQQQLHAQLQSGFTALQAQMTAMAISFSATAATTNITSGLEAAAQAARAAAQTASQMQQALSRFENQSNKYLSPKNKND